MNKLFSLSFHIIFFVLAIFSLNWISEIPGKYLPILELLPFVLTGLSFILGYRFNRSLVIYSAILFLLIYLYMLFSPSLDSQQKLLSLNSMTIFLSINVAILCFYTERGIFTSLGISRFIFIIIQAGVLVWLVYTKQPEWQLLITKIIFPALEIKLSFFGQAALLTVLFSVIVISSSYLTRANPFRSAIFVSMFLLLYALTLPSKNYLSFSVLLSYALLLPLLTLVSESYRMAFMDDLTNLPGRRALNETMHKLGSHYVIAMLDV